MAFAAWDTNTTGSVHSLHDTFHMNGMYGYLASLVSQLPGSGVGHSLGAGSPFTNYTAAVVVVVLLAGALITGLLIIAFVMINIGLLAKREEDKIGKREPSDLGILKTGIWPEEPDDPAVLPAEDEDKQKKNKDERKHDGHKRVA